MFATAKQMHPKDTYGLSRSPTTADLRTTPLNPFLYSGLLKIVGRHALM